MPPELECFRSPARSPPDRRFRRNFDCEDEEDEDDLVRPDQQAHQLRAIIRKMRIWSTARNHVASEIRTFRRTVFHVTYLGLCYVSVGCLNSQGNAGTCE